MNHFKLSIFKSILRIVSCITALVLGTVGLPLPAICMLGGGLAVAEFVGILEEVFDKRKE